MARPVLLVHGVRTSRTMWRAQIDALERLGHPVLAVDLPGHGRRRDERFTLGDAVATVHDGVRELSCAAAADGVRAAREPAATRKTSAAGGQDVVVGGLSLGAYVALRAVACDPSGVAAVVAAGCCTRPEPILLRAWALLVRAIDALPDRGAGLNQLMVDRTLTPTAARDLAAGGFSLEVMPDMLREVAGVDPLADLARITAPVWLVNGRYDHFRTHERRYVRAGNDVRLRIVPRAKHLVSLDAPVAFTRILLEAIEQVEPSQAVSPGAATRPAPRPRHRPSWAR